MKLDKLKEQYLDMYDGVKSEMFSTKKFDENSDLSTAYLGMINMTRLDKIKAEVSFIWIKVYSRKAVRWHGMSDTLKFGVSKSFMSKSHYLRCKSLHLSPKFASKMQRNQVGNGQYVSMFFIIPIVIDIHDHRFEIFTLVLEIDENVDLVLGIKNILN